MKRPSVGYAQRGAAPETLTPAEVDQLLRATGHRREDFRDHMIFSLAVSTGIREAELVALNVGDVFDGCKVRRRVALRVYKGAPRPRKGKRPPTQTIFIPDAPARKLARFLGWKKREGESTSPTSPLFCARPEGRAVSSWTRTGGRLSTRTVRRLAAIWSTRAGLDQRFNFHRLRHTAVTRLYESTGGDVRRAQKFARHASIQTTTIYTHPSDGDMFESVRRLPG
jgi:integrase